MKKVILHCAFYATMASLSLSCSSSSSLKKFKDEDLNKEIPADVIKKFEVKEVGTAQNIQKKPEILVPSTASVSDEKKKKKLKKEIVKKENTPVEVVSAISVSNPPLRRVDPTPFSVGEKLEYDIRYIGVTAATLNFEVLPNKDINNRTVFHLFAKAKTVKFFELVYRVDDSIESYWDYDGLFSHRFTMDLDESKQSRKLIELYDYEKKKSFYWNRVDHSQKGFSEQKEQHDIELWSQDVLSSFYYLRTAPLPKSPGETFSFPVILDGKPWQSKIQYIKNEKIYAGGRDFQAKVYHIENFQNNELKNKDNTLWISDDEHHYILRVETKVKVGTFAVALDKIK